MARIVRGEQVQADLGEFTRDLAEQRLWESLAELEEGADAVVHLVEDEEDEEAECESAESADEEEFVQLHLDLHRLGGVLQDEHGVLGEVLIDIHATKLAVQAVVMHFRALDLRLDLVEVSHALGEIERLGLPCLDVVIKALNLGLDGAAAACDRILAELLVGAEHRLVLGDLFIERHDGRMLGLQRLQEFLPVGLELIDGLLDLQIFRERPGCAGEGIHPVQLPLGTGCDRWGPIQSLIDIEPLEQVEFCLQFVEAAVEDGKVGRGAVPVLLQEADVVFLLESVHLLLFELHVFLEADEFILDGHGGTLTGGLAHLLFLGHVFVHEGIHIRGCVGGRLCVHIHHENCGFRELAHDHFHLLDRQVGVQRMHARFRTLEDSGALHQFDLCAEEIHELLGVCGGVIAEPQLPGHHHAPARAKCGRLLHRRPCADAQAEAEEEHEHPPSLFKEVNIADALDADPVDGRRAAGQLRCGK